jgi:hypothetical protein
MFINQWLGGYLKAILPSNSTFVLQRKYRLSLRSKFFMFKNHRFMVLANSWKLPSEDKKRQKLVGAERRAED